MKKIISVRWRWLETNPWLQYFTTQEDSKKPISGHVITTMMPEATRGVAIKIHVPGKNNNYSCPLCASRVDLIDAPFAHCPDCDRKVVAQSNLTQDKKVL